MHLRQGQSLFLIWFSSLDRPTKLGRHQPVQETFPPDLISGISGELQSLAGINKKIKDLDKTLTERVHSIEREQTYYRFIALVIMLVIGAVIANWMREGGISRTFSASASSAIVGTTNSAALLPASGMPAQQQSKGHPTAVPLER